MTKAQITGLARNILRQVWYYEATPERKAEMAADILTQTLTLHGMEIK